MTTTPECILWVPCYEETVSTKIILEDIDKGLWDYNSSSIGAQPSDYWKTGDHVNILTPIHHNCYPRCKGEEATCYNCCISCGKQTFAMNIYIRERETDKIYKFIICKKCFLEFYQWNWLKNYVVKNYNNYEWRRNKIRIETKPYYIGSGTMYYFWLNLKEKEERNNWRKKKQKERKKMKKSKVSLKEAFL